LVSDLLERFPEHSSFEPCSSSWALMPKDMLEDLPFSRWDDPENPIHQKQWQLTNLALDLVKQEGLDQQKWLTLLFTQIRTGGLVPSRGGISK